VRVRRATSFHADAAPSGPGAARRSTRTPLVAAPKPRKTAPVLVAVDGSGDDWEALEWAAAEAAGRQCALRILCVFGSPVAAATSGIAPIPHGEGGSVATAAAVVDAAASRARAIVPELRVSTHVQQRRRGTIRHEARRNALVVLGRHREVGLFDTFEGSVTSSVWRRHACPVLIVGLSGTGSSERSAGQVLVGVDASGEPATALNFAFRAAERRGIGVTVLHAVKPRRREDLDDSTGDLTSVDWSVSQPIDDSLRPFRDEFPEVAVRLRFARGLAGPTLAAESAGAALLVLGSRRRRWRRARPAYVENTVLRSARSPVAIVSSSKAALGNGRGL
jgi:nucleotide-binding universal stress UspA family protein